MLAHLDEQEHILVSPDPEGTSFVSPDSEGEGSVSLDPNDVVLINDPHTTKIIHDSTYMSHIT